MYNIIPLVLILISLSIITVIAARKFSALASLDIANIPAEKEARFKERIIGERLKRNLLKWKFRAAKIASPFLAVAAGFLKWAYNRLHELKEKYKKETAVSAQGLQERVDQLFAKIEEFKKEENWSGAEKALIEIIGLDNKNISAFKELGRVYFENKNYAEAKQTLEYILKLREDDEEVYESLAQIAKEKGDLEEARDGYLKSINIDAGRAQTYFDLAGVYEAMGNIVEAAANIEKALEIEPNNPRYLDMMLKISIIRKDKKRALTAYAKLAEANPDNHKLAEFKGEIEELKD